MPEQKTYWIKALLIYEGGNLVFLLTIGANSDLKLQVHIFKPLVKVLQEWSQYL